MPEKRDPAELTDPGIRLGKVATQLGEDVVRFRHVVIAGAVMLGMLGSLGIWFLGVAKEPTAVVARRVEVLEERVERQDADMRDDWRRLDTKVTSDIQRLRSEVLDAQQLMGSKVDRIDAKIDRLLDVRPPATAAPQHLPERHR